MRKVLFVSIAAAAVAALAIGSLAIAGAGKKKVSGDPMIGYQEVPAVSTQASGSFHATISNDDTSFDWTVSYADLEGDVTQSHIHFGQKSVNGGIAVFLCSNLPSPPAGTATCPESGEVTGTITKAQVIGPSAQGISAQEYDELLDAIRGGVAYVNVHTANFPGGEIRGQLANGKHHHHTEPQLDG